MGMKFNPTTGKFDIDNQRSETWLDSRYLRLDTTNNPLTGGLTFNYATPTIATSTNQNLSLVPNGTGYTIVGDASTKSIVYTIDKCVGGTVLASGENAPGEAKEKAFDDDFTGTKWLVFDTTPWIGYQFPGSNTYVIQRYTITSGNDSEGRDPVNWTFEGSNNGSTWDVLDTRTGEDFVSRNLTRTFDFSNTTAYEYYRVNISLIADIPGGITQINEIEMMVVTPATNDDLLVTGDLEVAGNMVDTFNFTHATPIFLGTATSSGGVITGYVDSSGSTTILEPTFTTGSETGWKTDGMYITGGRFDFDAFDGKVEFRIRSSPTFNIYDIGSGSSYLSITNSGNLATFKGAITTGGALKVLGSSDEIQEIIKAHSTQTANLTEWQNSSSTVLSGIDSGGVFLLRETTTPSAVTNYGKIYPKSDNNLYFQDGSGVEKTIHDSNDTIDISMSFETYDAEPSRSSEGNQHGGFNLLATAQPLDSVPTNIVISKGIGKILVVVNAGSDLVGDIIVTGTSVDRDTGATTGSDTDTLTVDSITTDSSDTDGNGNPRHSLVGAYITNKWFVGTVTISTTDLTLTDVDVYHVSFEQFNDSPNLTINTFDINLETTNVNAQFDSYLYALEVTGDKCNVSRIGSLNIGTDGETALVDKYWRLRRGGIAKLLDGTTDGVWVDIHYANSPAYVEDVSMKIWATKSQSITIN